MVDFEAAGVPSLRHAFPNAELPVCFYRLPQCIYRKVQTVHLQNTCAADQEFNKVRMVAAIAFVPEADVVHAFEALHQIVPVEM